MPLTDPTIKNFQPTGEKVRLWDSGGLYLEVTSKGSKLWRMKYRFQGKEKLLSFGLYPDVSLKNARILRDKARVSLSQGLDPSLTKRVEKKSLNAGKESFEFIAREWFLNNAPVWAKSHSEKIIRRLELDVFPWIGKRAITEIQAPELLLVFRRIEARGAKDTAHRAFQNCAQIFRFAISTGRASRNPVFDLKGSLAPIRQAHFSTITDPEKVGALLRAIDSYAGSNVTRFALRLAPLVFLRPGELRHGEWTEVSFESAEWRIPAEKMKARAVHVVPLSRQAIRILNEIHPLTNESRYIFPNGRTFHRPMSENAILAALRRMGYEQGEMTGHGFRSMASTMLNESGLWSKDAIERQLAHGERNEVRAAYNHAEYLNERREMLQWWADYLDTLKIGGTVNA